MFDYFQRHNTRVAIILGEYGEVLGIVTMKDVLKFIFGEISGKMAGQEHYKEEDENSYIVPGDMRLADFYNLTNFDIEDPVMTTIGGVAFRLFDRLPKIGDRVVSEGYEFVAREIKGLRISRLQVRKLTTDDVTEGQAVEQPWEELTAPEGERKQVAQRMEQPSEELKAHVDEPMQETQVVEGKDEEKPHRPGESK